MEASGQWLRWRPLRCVGALAAHDLQFARDFVDALLHSAAVGFELRFAFAAAHADAALLPRQVAPEPRQARQQMLELRQFDLQLAFARAGALGEDVEDERRAVENLAVENLLQVAALRGGKFVVEDDRVHVLLPAVARRTPRPCLCRCTWRRMGVVEFLRAVADDFAAGGGGQFGEFLERIAQVATVAGF